MCECYVFFKTAANHSISYFVFDNALFYLFFIWVLLIFGFCINIELEVVDFLFANCNFNGPKCN